MKITYQWIREYVDYDASPQEMADRLTMLGLEVESLEKVVGFEGVIVGEVLTREPHPNADRLWLCQVKDGKGQRSIVCGANNFEAGDKVPLILPGARLHDSEKGSRLIKKGKIRGVESNGMLCSGKELGLSEDADGLMILNAKAQVGQPLSDHLGVPEVDYVYDLEITPNRPDWNSVIGIAREISALSGNQLKFPKISFDEFGRQLSDQLIVRNELPFLCPRYSVRLIRNIKVAPSPAWLVCLLEKMGMRSINNVVDITNFVMLETGQPLHAFDHHLLGKGSGQLPVIVIRSSKSKERFTTLDGKEHILPKSSVMISDEEKAIALGGIMGGLNTEVSDETTDVLLETAQFDPQNIRATSKALGLCTEASYRFERGVDLEITDWASRRAVSLMIKLAGGELQKGMIDLRSFQPEKREIALRYERTDRLLGVSIPAKMQCSILKRLEIKPSQSSYSYDESHDEFSDLEGRFMIPSFRNDLKEEVDLIEEVARFFGIDKIPSIPPQAVIGKHSFDSLHDDWAFVKRTLAGMGLFEVQGQSLISSKGIFSKRDSERENVLLEHPLSSEMDLLRPSLLPGLIAVLSHNSHHEMQDLSIFEIGTIFSLKEDEAIEKHSLGLAMIGKRTAFWGEDTGMISIFDLKGCLEEVFDGLKIYEVSWRRLEKPEAPFFEKAEVIIGDRVIGCLGQIQPKMAAKAGLKMPVYLAELDLDLLLKQRRVRSFKTPIPFPSVRRDVAMSIKECISHDEVITTIKKVSSDFLESIELFDVFRGKGIAEGNKSVAYALVYRHKKRTLKETEVARAHEKVITQLREDLNAEIR